MNRTTAISLAVFALAACNSTATEPSQSQKPQSLSADEPSSTTLSSTQAQTGPGPAQWVSGGGATTGPVSFTYPGKQFSGTVHSLTIVNGNPVIQIGRGRMKIMRFKDATKTAVSQLTLDPSL